jgi:hydrogenase expression/formation protein HypE
MTGPSPLGWSCPLPETETGRIEIGHGGGGRLTRRLIDGLFRPAFAQSEEELRHDGAVVGIAGAPFAFTTDTYVVRPLFFPGGDIGTLAVCGTVNDLAMCGAEPLCLSVGLVIEEGFALADLHRIVQSMAKAAASCGVRIVTGDTKVVERGKGDGLYVNTSGVGRIIAPAPVAPRRLQAGDAIVLSGDIGRHGIAVLAAREGLDFETTLESDCAPLAAPVRALIAAGIDLHCLRDLTRGGLATALIEIAEAAPATLRVEEAAIPVAEPVRGACEILGLDPLYVANEGRFVAFVPADAAARAVGVLHGCGAPATVIGRVAEIGRAGEVHLETLGGTRALDLLTGEQLPRIC